MSRAWLLKLFAKVVLPQVGAAVAVELLQLGAIDHDDGDGAVPDDLSELDVNQRGEAVQVRFRNRLQQDRRHFVSGAASGRSVASVTNARAHQKAVFELHREDLTNMSNYNCETNCDQEANWRGATHLEVVASVEYPGDVKDGGVFLVLQMHPPEAVQVFLLQNELQAQLFQILGRHARRLHETVEEHVEVSIPIGRT